jgi:hypothetical protein
MAVQTYYYSQCVAVKGKGRVWHCKPAFTVSNLIGFSSAWQQRNITEESSRVQHANQCWAGTKLETWYIEWNWFWYQRTNQTHMTWGNTRVVLVLVSKNQPDSYDLRQYKAPTSTCLAGTWGNTSLITGLHMSQYQVHSIYLPHTSQKLALDPNTSWYAARVTNPKLVQTRANI